MRLANRTRYSVSIPRRLIREGRFYLLPLYYVMRLSYIAREGMENSGSYHFADHIYVSKPRGSFGIGTALDKILLSLPPSRSFRNRYKNSRDQLVKFILTNGDKSLNILSVPSGIPRELIETAEILRRDYPDVLRRVRFFCLDIDPAVFRETSSILKEFNVHEFQLIEGDAFQTTSYPEHFDAVTCTGFGEFLSDEELVRFYNVCFDCLAKGGVFITSATLRHAFSDYLMRNLAELLTQYRDEIKLKELFDQTQFRDVEFKRDPIGYQIFVKVKKPL